jgi:hypothetical protein
MSVRELLDENEIDQFLGLRLGYNHTEGTPDLRRAIASWYPAATTANVVVTAGAAEANFLAAWTLADRGASIAFMVPNFMQVHGLGRGFGADVRTFPLRRSDRWRPDVDALAAVVDASTRLISIVNPNNPTGAILEEGDFDAIAEIAERVGAWVLCDEIYRGMELDGRPETPSVWGRYDRTIVTSSTSKSLGHAGLRIGWAIAPEAMVGELVRRQDYSSIGTGPLNQFLAARILEPARRRRILERGRQVLQDNLDIVDRWVAGSGGRLSFDRPQAGGMVFVAYDSPIASVELARLAREQAGVFVVAGEWFGMDGHLRIGIGGEPETLQEGLRRLEAVIDRS